MFGIECWFIVWCLFGERRQCVKVQERVLQILTIRVVVQEDDVRLLRTVREHDCCGNKEWNCVFCVVVKKRARVVEAALAEETSYIAVARVVNASQDERYPNC